MIKLTTNKLEFFSLFSNNQSMELFENILFNIELWVSAASLKRVVSHWSTVLFPTFPTFFTSNFSFGNILSSLRVFFYYTAEDVDFAEPRNFDLSELPFCRSCLNRLLYQYAEISLSNDDVTCLVSHIFSCNDIEQKCEFLSLLSEISPFIKDRGSIALGLHPLLLTSNMKVFGWALRCALKLSPVDQINLIIRHSTMFKLNYDLLEQVLAVSSEGYYEALILAARMSIQIGLSESVLESMISLEWTSDLCCRIVRTKYWFVYLLLAACQTDRQPLIDDFVKIICQILFNQPTFKISKFGKVLGFLDMPYTITGFCRFSILLRKKIIPILNPPCKMGRERLY